MYIQLPVTAEQSCSNAISFKDGNGKLLFEITETEHDTVMFEQIELAKFLVEVINNADQNIDTSHVDIA